MNDRRLLNAIFLFFALCFACQAQQGPPPVIRGTAPDSTWDSINNTNFFRNGFIASNDVASVTGNRATDDPLTDEVQAEGDVTVLDHGHIWRGTNLIYNFRTGNVKAGSFKTTQEPFSLSGDHLIGNKDHVYTATNGIISTDDYQNPCYHFRAKTITIAMGQYFEAHQATLYWGKVPIFYFPYYKRTLGQHPNNFEFEPGYRSIFGPYLLSAYNWYGNGVLDGTIHADLREERGVAGGPDLALHLGSWGEAAFKYYYIDDQDPGADGLTAPHVKESRQNSSFYYRVDPTTNLSIKAVAEYESDPLLRRDFFEGNYNTNVEPATYAEATQLWPNYTLDALIQPRIVNFFETVERLPDVKLSGARTEVGESPLYYENETSVGYFKRAFSDTNSIYYYTNFFFNPNATMPTRVTNGLPSDYSASRVDTFHQFSMPENLFGWLNMTPYVGGRLTYYSDVDGPAIHTNQQLRAAFDTGMDVSFKASKIYREADSEFFDVHELRHIIEPEVDYAYVPNPTRSPNQLPQFDYQSPSLRLMPIEFPDYNNIDSIAGENVMRFTLRNKLQTKRADGIEDLINWSLYTDFSFHPTTNHPFSDLYSDIDIRPRSWLTFSSSTRYDMANTRWREAIESMMIQPSRDWSLSLSYRYLINNDPELQIYPGEDLPGHNLIGMSFYYRMNENWGLHVAELYEAQYGGMQQQIYSVYRDLRSWTANLFFRVTSGPGQPNDFTVGLTFSLKAFPRYSMGSDSDRPGALFSGPALSDPPTPY